MWVLAAALMHEGVRRNIGNDDCPHPITKIGNDECVLKSGGQLTISMVSGLMENAWAA